MRKYVMLSLVMLVSLVGVFSLQGSGRIGANYRVKVATKNLSYNKSHSCLVQTTITPNNAQWGSSISLQAVDGCPGGSFSFFERSGISGPWNSIRGWGSGSLVWNTGSSSVSGKIQFLVFWWNNAPTVQETLNYTISPCSPQTTSSSSLGYSSLVASPSNAIVGSDVTLQATSSCPDEAFAFFMRSGSSANWNLIRNWGGGNFVWNSSGSASGPIQFLAWVGQNKTSQAQVEANYTLESPPPPKPVPPTPKPVQPSPPPYPPSSWRVSGVIYHSQVYTEDCETASLQMALNHEGIYDSQPALLGIENVQEQGPVMNGSTIVKWGDPYISFVGNPDGAQLATTPTGYGTYYSNIARTAQAAGGKIIWSGTGLTISEMLSYIKENHPVIAWVDDNNNGILQYSPLNYWTAFDGRSIEYPRYGNEHNVLVVGVQTLGATVNSVLIYNPLGFIGPEWVSIGTFANTFGTFGNMAVVLG